MKFSIIWNHRSGFITNLGVGDCYEVGFLNHFGAASIIWDLFYVYPMFCESPWSGPGNLRPKLGYYTLHFRAANINSLSLIKIGRGGVWRIDLSFREKILVFQIAIGRRFSLLL